MDIVKELARLLDFSLSDDSLCSSSDEPVKSYITQVYAFVIQAKKNSLFNENPQILFLEQICTHALIGTDDHCIKDIKNTLLLFLNLFSKDGSSSKLFSFLHRDRYKKISEKEIYNLLFSQFTLLLKLGEGMQNKIVERERIFLEKRNMQKDFILFVPKEQLFYKTHKDILDRIADLLFSLYKRSFLREQSKELCDFFYKLSSGFSPSIILEYYKKFLLFLHDMQKHLILSRIKSIKCIVFVCYEGPGWGDIAAIEKIALFIVRILHIKEYYFAGSYHNLSRLSKDSVFQGRILTSNGDGVTLHLNDEIFPAEKIDVVVGFQHYGYSALQKIPFVNLGEYDALYDPLKISSLGFGKNTAGLLAQNSQTVKKSKKEIVDELFAKSYESYSQFQKIKERMYMAKWIFTYAFVGLPFELENNLKNRREDIVLFVRDWFLRSFVGYAQGMGFLGKTDDEGLSVYVNKNIILVIYHKLDTATFEQFLFLSDYPALITGDQSLTEAIQLQKPFIYEILSHKLLLFFELYKLAEQYNYKKVAAFLEYHKKVYFQDSEDVDMEKAVILKEDIPAFLAFLEKPPLIDEVGFWKLYFSDALKNEFVLFEKKLLGMNFSFWPIISLIEERILQVKKE